MKKIILTALIFSLSMILSGCDSKEQKAENEKNIRQAEKNAVAYIEEKYGFTPEIIESELERYDSLFGSIPESTAMVRMSYNNKEFSVYIDGETENTDGADNYQQNEIISALTEELSDKNENAKRIVGEIRSINIDGGKANSFRPIVEWNCENLYSEYFNGENFAEVFGNNRCIITADYVDANLISLDKSFYNFLLDNERVNLYMISYRSEKDYEERPDYSVFTDFTGIKRHAIQIEESLVFVNGETEHNEYILGQYDDFYYYVSDNTPDTVSFVPSDMPDASEYDGNGIIGGQFVTPAYSIASSVNERIYIYYPLSKLPEKSRLATCKKTDDGDKIHISPLADDIGGYRMVYFDAESETQFAFITEKENINNE